MRFAKALMALAASSLAVVPAMANPAASLSTAKSVRAATSAGKSSELNSSFIIPAIAIVAVITGIIIIATDDDDSDSV